jgi:hypothetical protein
LVGLRTEQVRARQRARLTPEDATLLSGLRKENGLDGLNMDSPEPSLQYAQDHVFERVSVASVHEMLTEALRHGRGRIDLSELRAAISLQESSGAIFETVVRSLQLPVCSGSEMIGCGIVVLGASSPLAISQSRIGRLRPNKGTL